MNKTYTNGFDCGFNHQAIHKTFNPPTLTNDFSCDYLQGYIDGYCDALKKEVAHSIYLFKQKIELYE